MCFRQAFKWIIFLCQIDFFEVNRKKSEKLPFSSDFLSNFFLIDQRKSKKKVSRYHAIKIYFDRFSDRFCYKKIEYNQK